jgi:metacaspase-1
MAKKALCVGINDYPFKDNDLNGCVNDAHAWAKLLVDHFDFPSSHVKVLIDGQATKAAILTALEELVIGAEPGDVLVFTNSSHGTYVADSSRDEEMYDEAICPIDCAENLIVDDELRELFANLADNVSLTVISDSCFSGTVTRAIPGFPTPDDRRVRFLYPELIGKSVLGNIYRAIRKGRTKYTESEMKDVLLSGCTDYESAIDAKIDGVYHGVMTYYALKAIQEADYQITYEDLHKRVLELIKSNHYPQNPRLEGRKERKESMIFT